MGKDKGGSMKKKANKAVVAKTRQPKRVWYRRHMLAIVTGLLLTIVLGVGLWIWYGQWADEGNIKKMVESLQTLQAREKASLKDGTFREEKECVQPVNGWLGIEPMFCEVTEYILFSAKDPQDIKDKIDAHYKVLKSSTDIITSEPVVATSLYPDLSNGFKAADDTSYSERKSGGGSISISAKTRGCNIAYTLLNHQGVSQYATQVESPTGYYLKAEISCDAFAARKYF